jgi:hypothetical protein
LCLCGLADANCVDRPLQLDADTVEKGVKAPIYVIMIVRADRLAGRPAPNPESACRVWPTTIRAQPWFMEDPTP